MSEVPEPADDRETAAQERRAQALARALIAHPRDAAELVDELRRRVHDETSLLDLLHRASRQAVRIFDDVNWAGVTTQFAGEPFTAAHTDGRVLVVDEGQYAEGNGPCLQAIRTGRPVTMSGAEAASLWPLLAEQIAEVGVQAFHAEPLFARRSSVGSLNLYSRRPGGMSDPALDADMLAVLLGYLERGLTDYSAAQPGEYLALRIRAAVWERNTVDYAVGILMATADIDALQARMILHGQAGHHQGRLIDAARQVIDEHTPPAGVPDEPAGPAR